FPIALRDAYLISLRRWSMKWPRANKAPEMNEQVMTDSMNSVNERQQSSSDLPLVVDLDGSLVRTDLLYESFFASIKDGIKHHWTTLVALSRGKASLKAYLA